MSLGSEERIGIILLYGGNGWIHRQVADAGRNPVTHSKTTYYAIESVLLRDFIPKDFFLYMDIMAMKNLKI
jgi:hypothetical protein